MREEVERISPEEACGMMAGMANDTVYTVTWIIPAVNILHSQSRYRIDPQEQLDAFNKIEQLRLEMVGIYHSHPKGPDFPSPTDVAEAYYPEAVSLIWSALTGDWKCRGFVIQEASVIEIPVLVDRV